MFLGERIGALTAAQLVAQGEGIDARRSEAEVVALAHHHRLAVPGLTTTPYMHHVGLVSRDRGVVAFNRLERAFLPVPPSWVHPEFGAGFYASRVRGESFEAQALWPFAQDCPVGDFQLNLPPKWWSHGLVHALVGFGAWPGLTEWDIMHMSRLSEALASFHWYWLAELGRMADDSPLIDLSDLRGREAMTYLDLEVGARDPSVRLERLRSRRSLAIAENGIGVLNYEAFAYQFGMTSGQMIEPEQRSLGFGEACEYAKVHYRRLTSSSFARWLEHCLVPDVDYATNHAAFDLRCSEALRALVEPCQLREDVSRERGQRVLTDLGQRLCHLAALREQPSSFAPELTTIGDALATLRADGAIDADGVVAEVLARLGRDIAQPAVGPGPRELLALGYAPMTDPKREPIVAKAARAEALVRRAWSLQRAVGAGVEGLSPLALSVVDGIRIPSLTLELRERADAVARSGDIEYVSEAFVGWLDFVSNYWGPPDGHGNLDQRWRYRLAWSKLPDDADLAQLVAMPNPYLSQLPLSFNARWFEGLLEKPAGTIGTLRPRPAHAVEYCLVGPGRRGPVLTPLTPELAELIGKLAEPVRLDVLIARGIARSRIARAIADEYILVFHKPDHPAPPIEHAFALGSTGTMLSEDAIGSVDTVAEWNDPAQVDAYEAFSARSSLYEDTSRELVERAGIMGDHRVGDLAVGTGTTTRAALARLGPEGRVIGVDPSDGMLARARANISDARATFQLGSAEKLCFEALENGPLPRIVCNSALWLNPDIRRELGRVRGAMEPGGLFAFSIPAAFLGYGEHLVTPAVASFGLALQEARAELGIEPSTAKPLAMDPALGDIAAMRDALEVSAFSDVDFQLWNRPWTATEYLDWLALPVVRNGMVPPERKDESANLIAAVRKRLDPELAFDNPYYFVVARAFG